MKINLIIVLLVLATGTYAQEFKVARSTGRLEVYLSRVTIEGYNGNEILFSAKGHRAERDERAAGLRAINAMGLEDNTGLGINVTEKEGIVEVYQLKKIESPDVKILVPKGVIVSCSHQSQYAGAIVARNIENELEISVNYNSIELENITGPITAKTVYGHIETTFGPNVKGPVSMVSVYGYIDITLPVAIKANLKMNTSYGELLVAPEFKIEIEKEGDFVRYGDRVQGKINGGGLNVSLRSDYGKVYLRKK
jgi:hypothetical protein